MMSSKLLCAVLLVVCALKFSSTQSSCRGRCGAEYYRGYMCQCDYSCLSYEECCRDYESQCTTKNSCKGRCGETFRRGRLCSCDPDCSKFKQCCPDYSDHCDADEISEATSETAPMKTNSCEILHDKKPKEATLTEDTKDSFSEGNINDDYSNPLATATAYPPDDPSDMQDQETSPTPESSSGLEPSTADLLDDVPTETPLPTVVPEFTTERVFSPTEATLLSLYPTVGEATTVSSDASDPTRPPDQGMTLPQPPTEEDSNQPTSTSKPTTSSITETTTNILPADEPELTTINTQDSNTVLETSQVTTTSPTATSEATTSDTNTEPNPGNITISSPSLLADVGDPSTTASPTGTSEATTSDTITEPNPGNITISSPTLLADVEDPSTTASPTGTSEATTSDTNTEPNPGNITISSPSLLADVGDPSTTASPTGTSEATTSDTITEPNPGNITISSPTLLADVEDPSTTASPTGTSEATTSDTNTEPNPGNITISSPTLLVDVEDPSTTASPIETGVPTSTVSVQDQTTDTDTEPETTTAEPLKVTLEPTAKPQDKPESSKLPPTSKPEIKPVDPQTQNPDNPGDYQGDDNNDPNLCSGRPVSGVTTLRNGTMVVFRGHYFWFLDRNHVPTPPRGITQVWGIPSPIDTVFTRCNCQGKTYIFKGGKYWRFENDALDPGYPKLIKTGFDGLKGHITAALSVPQHQSRKESVYFFKRGGFVQKYSYQFGTSPTCGGSVRFPIYTVRARLVRQAVSVLEPEINIRKSWRGFPHTITAAVSVPSTREPDGYKYVVFSRSTSYNVRMTAERPIIMGPKPNTSSQTNTFFKCQRP